MDVHRRLGIEPDAYSGATADVFLVDGKAYKVFRVYGVARIPDRVRSLFESECDAYSRAKSDAWLRLHTAAFYGTSIAHDIFDTHGNSVAHFYALDCCYGMELLCGKEAKCLSSEVRKAYPYLEEADK
jgi:hypothetical protein